MSDWRTRSFWLAQGSYEPCGPLEGPTSCDVVVVGGGFTGLWSAIQLKDADPSVDVVVIEQEVAGYGASGRNGGFALTLISRNLHDLVRKVGARRARATHVAARESLREIEEFVAKEKIDAHVENPGLLTVSNGPEQDVRIRQDIQAAQRLDLGDFHFLSGAEIQEMLHSERLRCGHFEDDGLLLDPAALARGLRDAALRRGVRIFEGTPVDALEDIDGRRVEARTPFGTVHADRGLLATNAYAHAQRELRRFLFTIYAYIVVTEPLSAEQWSRIGWDKRMGVEDKRVMPHFHRPTHDGRILWGGRDAPFSRQGPNRRRDRDPRIFARLEETFRWTFPQLADVRVDRGWAGPVCGTLNCFASVGWLSPTERIAYALGYAGHGVGPSHLVGKIVRDMMLNRQSDLLDLPMVTKKPLPLPPVPLRWPAMELSQRILQHADDVGDDGGFFARVALRALQ
ncbi:MAG: FAD-binding oxidoreductase [Actinomycetota bacterium]|nr:FAD-binding oxidoreductase [Actinomycetota bacterium]